MLDNLTRDLLKESFNFLIRQKYPNTGVVNSLKDHLSDKFELNGNGTLSEFIAGYAYFRFTYIEKCLVGNNFLFGEMGKEKAIDFKVREGVDVESLVERAFNLLSHNYDLSLYSLSIK